jgi:multidrug efflux pump subunit AcrA (membrane-fusion protein)
MTDRTAAAGGPRRRSSTTLFAWALRILLLVAAGAALSLALFERTTSDRRAATYLCPMHPQIRAPNPGRCPICGMALVSERAAAPAGEAGPPFAPGDLHTVRTYIFTTPTHAPAWIDADGAVVALLYRDEVEGLETATSSTFSSASAPEVAAAVTRESTPPRAWDAETLAVRFRFAGPAPARPGAPGWVDVARAGRPVRAVEEALVFTDDGGGRYVLVPTPDGGSFERRAVEIGRVINGRAVIVSGLREGERIVRRRAFFLDAELRSRAAPAAGDGP